MSGAPGEARAIVLDAADDVATVLVALAKGDSVGLDGAAEGGGRLTANAAIPRCHKIAVRAVAVGEPVRKYGAVIGLATAAIAPGDHVHEHNVRSRRAQGEAKRG